MTNYNLVVENPESTVVGCYEPMPRTGAGYQSEADLENAFIGLLKEQAYEYLPIHTEEELIKNLRQQLEKLNKYEFSDAEWQRFFASSIANPNNHIVEKTTMIQEDHIQLLTRDNGTTKNIYLLDKADIHNNYLQVVNQYSTEQGTHANRYDVTILVNGLPLVHIELKRRGIDIKEAFNQINRYQRESFWAGSGLFEYVQLFVISNGTHTKYYSNTTRESHIKITSKAKNGSSKQQTSHSFEFTSWWADAKNRPIPDLMDFGKTFFAKHTLLNMLTRYCVFTADKLLLVMRPYQVVATEAILNRVKIAYNSKWYGSVDAGGYVWHTTGSGKTLTSFKTAQLASKLPFIEKVLFVVDRKDLDYQTTREYDKFEKGAANSNTNTRILKKQLESNDPKKKIIITTIQKLSIFIKQNPVHDAYLKNTVLIFDECHRSQFGDMHVAITKKFKKYYIFGFTGTPIFPENAGSGKPNLMTTEHAFGRQLHTYTIVNAINDKNVLPFKIEYIRTIKEKEEIEESKVWDIAREAALADPRRISNIVTYILQHFNQKTKRNDKSYPYSVLRNVSTMASSKGKAEEIREKISLTGFNSIFAVSSIDTARMYYTEFKRQMEELPISQRLKVATIYSYGANENLDDFLDDENSEDTVALDQSSRDFLESAIRDYNAMFGTSYDTSSDKFQNYYKDVSLRMKNRELDLLIVVNMFLTGFDATTLNTLWVDKNLRMHGLMQAYSRTNRILNSIKTFGNIVCFRNLEDATNQSISLFGDETTSGMVLLKSYDDYYYGFKDKDGKEHKGYEELVAELIQKYPLQEQIIGEENKRDFVKLYGAILKLKNILSTFDAFEGQEILPERDVQDYHSIYIDLYHEFRAKDHESEKINDDIVFEMELIKQVEINIDYILMLVGKYQESHHTDTEIIVTIKKAIGASPDMRNKKALILNFIESLTPDSEVDAEWRQYVNQQRKIELDQIIQEENLNPANAYEYMDNAFKDGFIQTTGTSITKVLPPVSRFTPSGDRTKKRETVLEKLKAFFDKFYDIASGLISSDN